MHNRVLVRLATYVASLGVASFVIFWATNALPGDIAQILLGTNASPGEVEKLKHELGLDRHWLLRYFDWLVNIIQGNFGNSLRDGSKIWPQIADKFAVTGWLISFGMILALAIAIPLGTFAAVNRRRWTGFTASAISQIGLSIPAFWLGMLLVIPLAVNSRLLPANGYIPFTVDVKEWAMHLILPVTALALVQASVLSRYVRSAVIEVLNEDYFRTARSVGWSRLGALIRHGTRNIALSLVTVLGLQLAALLVGTIIIEQVFALPGLGSLLLSAVSLRDLTLVQGIVFVLVISVLTLNLIIDLGYLLIDPRLRSKANRV